MASKFELLQTATGKYRFNLIASNGEIILRSETYETKGGAKSAIQAARKNAVDINRFERRTSYNGYPYFILKSANGMEIGRSETYHSTTAMENNIVAVRNSVKSAEILSLAN